MGRVCSCVMRPPAGDSCSPPQQTAPPVCPRPGSNEQTAMTRPNQWNTNSPFPARCPACPECRFSSRLPLPRRTPVCAHLCAYVGLILEIFFSAIRPLRRLTCGGFAGRSFGILTPEERVILLHLGRGATGKYKESEEKNRQGFHSSGMLTRARRDATIKGYPFQPVHSDSRRMFFVTSPPRWCHIIWEINRNNGADIIFDPGSLHRTARFYLGGG